jgi:hypothetical protein
LCCTSTSGCEILGFSREADEICAPLGYYAEYIGNSLPTFRDILSVPSSGVKKSKKFLLGSHRSFFLDFLSLEDETDRLFRNVGKELPPYARNSPEERGCQVVFGCVLLTESNVMHFLVPKFLLRSVAFNSSPFCIQNSVGIFRRCRLRVSLRAHWVYENLFRNLLDFASLGYTVAKYCRGTYGIRVRCDVRLACRDVILARVNLQAFLRNVLSAFSESPPLTSVCLCQTAWPDSGEQRKACCGSHKAMDLRQVACYVCRKFPLPEANISRLRRCFVAWVGITFLSCGDYVHYYTSQLNAVDSRNFSLQNSLAK